MKQKKLKRLFAICFIILIILLVIPKSSTVVKEKDSKGEIEQTKQNSEINIEEVHKFEKINYNNPSSAEIKYINDLYPGTAKCTSRGLEIYSESIYSGKRIKIITSEWPQSSEIANLIPEPKYGELNKIEYDDDWIKVFINDADKKDAKDYLKIIKKIGFDKNEKKDDGNVMLKYEVENDLGNKVEITYMKNNKNLTIYAKK